MLRIHPTANRAPALSPRERAGERDSGRDESGWPQSITYFGDGALTGFGDMHVPIPAYNEPINTKNRGTQLELFSSATAFIGKN
jgi:hypothetical protein